MRPRKTSPEKQNTDAVHPVQDIPVVNGLVVECEGDCAA